MTERNEGMTLMNDGAWGQYTAHRGGSFHKVENGFILKVKVTMVMKPNAANDFGERSRIEERKYVYYSVEEFIMALTNYLNAEKNELRGVDPKGT